MVATVPFGLILSVLAGLAFAASARRQFGRGAQPWGRELAAVLSFEVFLGWPAALYLCVAFPDWSWMYLVDPHRLPTGTVILVLLAAAATLVGGYLLGWALVRTARDRLLFGVLGGGSLVLLILAIAARGRLWAAGTFSDYHAGRAPVLTEGKLGWALLVILLCLSSGAFFVGLTLFREGRRD